MSYPMEWVDILSSKKAFYNIGSGAMMCQAHDAHWHLEPHLAPHTDSSQSLIHSVPQSIPFHL